MLSTHTLTIVTRNLTCQRKQQPLMHSFRDEPPKLLHCSDCSGYSGCNALRRNRMMPHLANDT